MDRRDQGVPDHQPAAPDLRVHDLGRAQAARPHAAPLRPEPRRAVRPAAADRRPRQADPQGELLPGHGRGRPLHQRAGALGVHGARRLQRDPVRPGVAHLEMGRERRGRRRPDLADPDLRAQLARDLRLHRRRLGLALEVRAARLDAHLRADGLVRGLAHVRRARCRADEPLALARRHRQQAARHDLVHRAAVRRLPRLLHRRDRGDEPAAVRPSRRPTPSSSPATTPSTAACASGSSRWRST